MNRLLIASAPKKGFTIVELLIVIVVIGILAAIGILAYKSASSNSQEVSVKNDMINIGEQMDLYRIDNNRYPTIAQLQAQGVHVNKSTYGVNPTGATIFYCVDDVGSTFSLVARVKSTELLQYLSTYNKITLYTGSTTAPQLCLDSGVPGTTSTVTYTGFTNNGSWYSWVN